MIGSDARLVWKDIYSLRCRARSAAPRTTAQATVGAALAGHVRARRPPLRLRYTVRGVDPGLPRRRRLHLAHRRRVTQLQPPAHHLRQAGQRPSSAGRATWSSTAPGSTTSLWPAGRRRIASCTSTTTSPCAAAGASAARCCSRRSATTSRSTRTTASAAPTASGLEFEPFAGRPRLPNLDYVLSLTTPQRGGVELDALVLWGKDENFYEWSSADIIFLNVGAAWKPDRQAARRRALSAAVVPPPHRRLDRRHPPHPARQGGVPDLAPDLRARGRRVQQRLAGRPARRLAHQPADLHSRPPAGSTSAPRTDVDRSAPTGCSRISRRRARWCSPATATRWPTSRRARTARLRAPRWFLPEAQLPVQALGRYRQSELRSRSLGSRFGRPDHRWCRSP